MDRIQTVNIERIEWACQQYGITHAQLAASVGVPESTINRLFAGNGITFNNLQKIAEFFGHGVLFFVEQGSVDATAVYTPQFRTILNRKPNLSAKLRRFVRGVEKQREAYLALQEAISEPGAAFTPPDIAGLPNGPQIVRDWLNLSTDNNFSTTRTKIEEKGVLVFLSNGYNGKWQIPKDEPILGFSIYHNYYPVIVVKKESEQRQLFTLMHELAHLLIHKTSWVDDRFDLESYTGQEQVANALAGRVLVPDAVLGRINDQERPTNVAEYDEWLADIRQERGVSGEVILRRLLDSGRLLQENYTAYRQWKSAVAWEQKEGGNRSYRYREPIHMFGDGFVRTVFEALQAKEITLTKASGYLDNLRIQDVHELERYCCAHV
ncbi:MAG: ImmA/IrrE family metallo-endopeptidase [SAR202 cluster bacterium]|nr:ImmA/IrrE family metallo-endopeptidase [SAR202 cluster bacterium]